MTETDEEVGNNFDLLARRCEHALQVLDTLNGDGLVDGEPHRLLESALVDISMSAFRVGVEVEALLVRAIASELGALRINEDQIVVTHTGRDGGHGREN